MNNTEKKETRAWYFVEKHYPNYSSSDLIAYSDDLQKIIEKQEEEGSDAEHILKNDFDGERDSVVKEYNRVMREIYEDAIKNFLTLQK